MRGIKTNISFLENVLRHPEFQAGEATTFFIEKNSRDLFRCVGVGVRRREGRMGVMHCSEFEGMMGGAILISMRRSHVACSE